MSNRMSPAKTEAELKERLMSLGPGKWLCPCGATVMKEWDVWCPFCRNKPSAVPWLAGSQEKTPRNKRNKNRKKGVRCVCEHCGVTFIARRADSKYHSRACRQGAYRKRNTPHDNMGVTDVNHGEI